VKLQASRLKQLICPSRYCNATPFEGRRGMPLPSSRPIDLPTPGSRRLPPSARHCEFGLPSCREPNLAITRKRNPLQRLLRAYCLARYRRPSAEKGISIRLMALRRLYAFQMGTQDYPSGSGFNRPHPRQSTQRRFEKEANRLSCERHVKRRTPLGPLSNAYGSNNELSP
jgi:hypothetical protein